MSTRDCVCFQDFCAEIEVLQDEVARLREVLEKIAALDVPRPVLPHGRYRADGNPSKNDRCAHAPTMWEDCADCVADYARAALAKKEIT